MSKIIKFIASDEYMRDVTIKPYPAKNKIPDWWKNQSPYLDTETKNPNKLTMNYAVPSFSFKKCTPMLDAITSGYFIDLWADVLVEQVNGYPTISWKIRNRDVFQVRGQESEKMEPPHGYSKVMFKFVNGWTPKTPSGYSCLITNPHGYKNSPFFLTPTIIDTDKAILELTPTVWVKEGFEGIVEKGLPLVQILPFKREAWDSEYDGYKDGEYAKIEDRTFNSVIKGHYLKNYWSKKEYK
jgi:hypothetical protein